MCCVVAISMINWQLLILKLRKHIHYGALAKEVGCNYQHILRLSRGDVKEPKWSAGVKLLDFYYDMGGEMKDILI
jgi:hypothetical protein